MLYTKFKHNTNAIFADRMASFLSKKVVLYLPSMFKQVLFLLILLHSFVIIFAQKNVIIDSIEASLQNFSTQNNKTRVFVHTDKSVYNTNEHIWFTAYLFNNDSILQQHQTLHVILTNQANKKVLLQEKFVVTNGIANGALLLPDSLEKTNYTLIAYSNISEQYGSSIFSKKITIKNHSKQALKLILPPYNSNYTHPDTLHNSYRLITKDDRLLKNHKVSYSMLLGNKVLYQQNTITDFSGDFIAKIPASIYEPNSNIYINVMHEKNSVDFFAPFELNKKNIQIQVLPESGHLIEGLTTNVAIDVRYADGKKVNNVELAILADTDTINIVAVKNGTTYFQMLPNKNRKYGIVVLNKNYTPSNFSFPKVEENGYNLFVYDALSNDSLTVKVGSTLQKALYLTLHNNKEIFYSASIKMQKNEGIVKVPITGATRGFATLVLYDSLGNAVAERSVFPSFHKKIRATITTDSISYQKRSKVNVTITLQNADGTPALGYFSMAAVTATRYDSINEVNVDDYFLNNYFNKQNQLLNFSFTTTANEMNAYLLTNAYTKYNWHEIKHNNFEHTKYVTDTVEGTVLQNGKTVKKEKQIIILNKSINAITPIQTDVTGKFLLDATLQYTVADNKIFLIVGNNTNNFYSLNIKDKYQAFNKNIAANTHQQILPTYLEQVVDDASLIANTTLVNVTVKSTIKDDETYGPFSSKTCRDWVCQYNILNCTNHTTGTRPINGSMYSFEGRKIIYFGCSAEEEKKYIQLNGIYYAKEYFKADYAKFNPPAPEPYSTLDWEYLVKTDSTGKVNVPFYTNDVTGKMIIHLQGISSNEPFSGKQYFTVKK